MPANMSSQGGRRPAWRSPHWQPRTQGIATGLTPLAMTQKVFQGVFNARKYVITRRPKADVVISCMHSKPAVKKIAAGLKPLAMTQNFFPCLVFGPDDIGMELGISLILAWFYRLISLVVAYLTGYVILISKAKYIFVSCALGIEYKGGDVHLERPKQAVSSAEARNSVRPWSRGKSSIPGGQPWHGRL